MSAEYFISEINKLSSKGIPFIFLMDFEMKKPFVCRLEDAAAEGVFYYIKGSTNYRGPVQTRNADIGAKYPVSRSEYGRAFDIVQQNLHAGNTYLINLTFPSVITCDSDLQGIFTASDASYKLLFKDEFVLFSPECFIRIEEEAGAGKIFSYPMKGTIDASVPDAEKIILADKKESWEHNTIVDLIRNDLSIVSDHVRVGRFRYIDRITTPRKDLLQVSSEISGLLPEYWRRQLGDIIMNLLPAGSISGAPKKKTVEIIAEAENGPRGYYTGIFGVFDGSRLDSAVNIRFIERRNGKLLFRSGGGITANSEMNSEYTEMIDKINVPSNS